MNLQAFISMFHRICVVQENVRHFRVASYQPQGKVMFSEAFVCLRRGGGSAHPPGTDI